MPDPLLAPLWIELWPERLSCTAAYCSFSDVIRKCCLTHGESWHVYLQRCFTDSAYYIFAEVYTLY